MTINMFKFFLKYKFSPKIVFKCGNKRNFSLLARQMQLKACLKYSNCLYSDLSDLQDCGTDLEIPSLEEEYSDLPRSCRISGDPHNVLVIQPYIKWGQDKKIITTPELQLEEAVSLIHTLPLWKVIDTSTVSLKSFDSKYFFGKGQLERLKELAFKTKDISAIFLNVKTLKTHQQLFLEQLFRMPVYDRYNIIINIFKEHATSKEARLMVALGELPYLTSKLKGLNYESTDKRSTTSKDVRLKILSERETKLKKSLLEVRKNRELLRRKRKSLNIPVVAVVGYTNVGKTSLIKVLTEKNSLVPEDKLFATLDVTVHEGFLPRNLKVLFVDTIGFITDIPTSLIEPFVATFEDTVQADVIIIVEDLSHPNHKAQHEVVMSTLKKLNLKESVMNNLIHVYNKCDKLEAVSDENRMLVSCSKGTGIELLKDRLEEAVIASTGMKKITFKVKTGGEEFSWLFKETSVYSIDVDSQDQQYCYVSVLIPPVSLEIFKKKFIPSLKNEDRRNIVT